MKDFDYRTRKLGCFYSKFVQVLVFKMYMHFLKNKFTTRKEEPEAKQYEKTFEGTGTRNPFIYRDIEKKK